MAPSTRDGAGFVERTTIFTALRNCVFIFLEYNLRGLLRLCHVILVLRVANSMDAITKIVLGASSV